MKRVMTIKQSVAALMVALMLMSAVGCKRGAEKVEFARYEQVLFETPVEDLQAELVKEKSKYASPLINCEPENVGFMDQLTAFVTDPFMKEIYRLTDSCYRNLGWLEKELGKALENARRMSPEVVPSRYYTMLTGDLEDYRNRVFCYDGDLVVSIDHYVVPYTKHLGYCNCPMYIVQLSNKQYIAVDCMAAIARSRIAMPEGEMTLLDYIVMEGKVQYFLAETMPWTADTLRLRYSGEQLNWMEHSEKNVWGYFIQNDLLYEKDMSKIHNLIDEAPKTNAFRNSAPRTTDYIGLQIVKAYMKRSRATIDELFADNNSQAILTKSNYKP